jgi:hypothetical protein
MLGRKSIIHWDLKNTPNIAISMLMHPRLVTKLVHERDNDIEDNDEGDSPTLYALVLIPLHPRAFIVSTLARTPQGKSIPIFFSDARENVGYVIFMHYDGTFYRFFHYFSTNFPIKCYAILIDYFSQVLSQLA